MKHDLERGVIQDNALKAAVTSKLFKSRVEKVKKGKGSYNRKEKHKSAYQRKFDKRFFDLNGWLLLCYNLVKQNKNKGR